MTTPRLVGEFSVAAVGLGGAPIALGAVIPDESSAIRMVHAALDAGVTFLDTADVYSPHLGHGYSESVFGRAVRTWAPDRDDIVIATKGGKYWGPDGKVRVDGRPEYLAKACEASLGALGTDVIGLYQLHEPDPAVPFEESIGALVELRAAGKIRQIGISNVNADLIRRAVDLTPIASVQNRLGPDHRDAGAEIRLCEELGIAFLAWGPLGGLRDEPIGISYEPFTRVGRRHGVSPQRVAIAWELSLSQVVLPIPGATRPETILDSLGATALVLGSEDLQTLGGLTFDTPDPVARRPADVSASATSRRRPA